MTFVVTESCIRCKYTDCVEVCPVDCFHEGQGILVINPEECIDCNLCVPECPVEAIYPDDELPEDQKAFLEFNRRMSEQWPVIDVKKPAPEQAEHWKNAQNKRQFLVEDEGASLKE